MSGVSNAVSRAPSIWSSRWSASGVSYLAAMNGRGITRIYLRMGDQTSFEMASAAVMPTALEPASGFRKIVTALR